MNQKDLENEFIKKIPPYFERNYIRKTPEKFKQIVNTIQDGFNKKYKIRLEQSYINLAFIKMAADYLEKYDNPYNKRQEDGSFYYGASHTGKIETRKRLTTILEFLNSESIIKNSIFESQLEEITKTLFGSSRNLSTVKQKPTL